ncbi:hypothetical protein [Corynebacterium evansiae]|uniref:hypothetical protein n=1 Tax=Corynebacterium evansiae TaxID=2913499 RepID=UPI003EBF883D
MSYIYLFVPSTDSGSFGFNEHTPYALGLSSDVTTPGSRPFSLLHGRIRFTEALFTKYMEYKLGNVFRALSEGNPFAYCRCSFTMPHPPAPAVGRVAFPLFKYRTAKQPRRDPSDHFREVLHRRWIMLTSPSTPSWSSLAIALLASCAVLKQRQVFNHTGRAETKSLLSFLY